MGDDKTQENESGYDRPDVLTFPSLIAQSIDRTRGEWAVHPDGAGRRGRILAIRAITEVLNMLTAHYSTSAYPACHFQSSEPVCAAGGTINTIRESIKLNQSI